jgi:hypothetical protein
MKSCKVVSTAVAPTYGTCVCLHTSIADIHLHEATYYTVLIVVGPIEIFTVLIVVVVGQKAD